MDSFDIRPRNLNGVRTIFATRVGRHVVARPSGRAPVLMHESKWLKLKVWNTATDARRTTVANPDSFARVTHALQTLGHATITQISKEAGVAPPTVHRVINQLHDQAPKGAYVWNYDVGKEGNLRIQIWALGDDPDAERPHAQSREVRREKLAEFRLEYEARKAERQRKAVRSNTVPMRDELTAAFFGSAR